jgi:hypothetical protein
MIEEIVDQDTSEFLPEGIFEEMCELSAQVAVP